MAENEVLALESKREFNGSEKAAILLMVIGEEEASKVLQHMSPDELENLGQAMTSLTDITQREIHSVLQEFSVDTKTTTPLDIGAYDYLKNVLKGAVGSNKANSILSRVVLGPDAKGIEVLKWMTPETIYDFIKDEHPQIIATLLTQLDGELAGKVLESLEKDLQSRVIERIALMEDVNAEALEELDDLIEDYFKKDKPGKVASVGGPSKAAAILNNVKTDIEASVMEDINSRDEELGGRIKGLMFVFDNLLDVSDRDMQSILREASQDSLVMALKGASNDVKEKIFKNMSKRAAELLRDDLETSGPAKITDVEDAQKDVIEVALRLAEDGTIVIGASDDYI